MHQFKLHITLLFLLIAGFTFAQKEGLYWYFGGNAGLKFHSGQPEVLLNGKLSTAEGCSAISSPHGELLFYTDGITVYNANHQVMENGNDLLGSPSATQSGVIVPVPNDTTMFYIFTVNSLEFEHTGFRYSLVDLNANNGFGAVVAGEKNILITDMSTERVTSVHHQNDYGVWVIMHEWESSRFRSYLITSEGIDLENPVYSTVGSYHGVSNSNIRDGIGYMKISPAGNKLAVAIAGQDIVEVFDFDDVTGEISNPIQLEVDTLPYGVEFSSGAEFLYASERKGDKIYQWDMQAGSPEEIINSREVVVILENPFGGALQMASDGKIYIARKSKFYLSVINSPEKKGAACGFAELGIDLGGRQSKEGLPTFIQSYFNSLWIIPENQCIDEEIFFFVNSVVNLDSIHWDFGDPQSGPSNTMTGFVANHYFSAPGNYNIKATCHHLMNYTIITHNMKIIGLPDVELGEDIEICMGDEATFSVEPIYSSYMWNNDPTNSDHVFKTSEEGIVTLQVTNVCGEDDDDVYLYLRELPEIDLGEDTSLRYQEEIYLDAGSHEQYLWQDGLTNSDYIVINPGKYWVDVWDDLGCKSSDTILIEPVPFEFFVPNAFAPEGHNSSLEIFSTYSVDVDFEFMVFNRWGELVFQTNERDEFWDGKFNGTPCPMEVYIWVLNAKALEDNAFFSKETKLTGNVTLIR